ncbi:calcium-binding protein [Planktomarina temperata]|nr:calcium-binding protein [Planktomarina temperata]
MTIQQHASFDSSAAELNATSKLVKAWESKNAKNAAKAGGVSLMALSLAACGGSDTPAVTQAQLDAANAAATAAAAAQATAEAESAAAAAAQAAAEADAATAAEAQAAAEAAAAAAAVAQAAAEAAEAALKTPVVEAFEATTAETLNGGAGNDTFTGAGTFYTNADKINDIYSNDADTANLTATGDITPDVTGVETVNLTVNSTATKIVTASSMAGVNTLTLTRGDVTVGDAVIAGNKAHDINALDAADVSSVVIAGTATTVALDQANTSGVTLDANVATGNVTVVGAGTINASGAGTGDTVTVTAMTLAQAGNTAAGETAANANAVVVNTGAETVSIASGGGGEVFDGTISVTGATTKNVTIAAASGGATVNVLGETGTIGTAGVVVKGIDDSGATITTSYVGTAGASPKKGVIEVDGTSATTDVATISAAGVTTLHTLDGGGAGQQVETVNLSGNGAAVTYELTGAATTYNITGSQDVTLSGNESSFDGKTVADSSTGTSTVEITTLNDSDLSKVSVDNILVSSNVASKTLTLGDNATVTLGTDVTTAFAVAGKKADYTVNLATGDDTAASGATIDITTGTLTASSNVKTLNIDATVGKLTIGTATTAATTTDITISGTKDVDLGGVTAKSVVSTSTGKISVDASATSLVTVTTAGGNDTIVMDEAAKVTVNSGAGNDTVTAAAAAESLFATGEGNDTVNINNANAIVVNGGAGNDTFKIKDDVDSDAIIVGGEGDDTLTFLEDSTGTTAAKANFAFAGIETIDITAGGVTISAAQFAGDNEFKLVGDSATADVLAITNGGTVGATIDASNVTFAATQGASLNITGKASLKDVITGTALNDTITATTGGDVIDGGAGTDTFLAANLAATDIEGGTSDSSGVVINLGSTAVTNTSVLSKTSSFTADSVTSVGGGEIAYVFAAGGATNSSIVGSITGVENITGTAGADYIVGSTVANVITGGTGVDYLVGGVGNDTFVQTYTDVDTTGGAVTDIIADWSAGDSIKVGTAGAGATYSEAGATVADLATLLTAAGTALNGTVKIYVGQITAGASYAVLDDDGTGYSEVIQLDGVALADIAATDFIA